MNTSLVALWLTLLTKLHAEEQDIFYPSRLVQEEFSKIGQIKDDLSPWRRREEKQRVCMGRRREDSTSFYSSYFRHQATGCSLLWYFQIVLKFYPKVIYRTSSMKFIFILVHFPWLKSYVQDTCVCRRRDGLFWTRLICALSPYLVYGSVYVVFAVFFTNSLLLLWLPSQWILELNLPEIAAMITLWCSNNHSLEKIF